MMERGKDAAQVVIWKPDEIIDMDEVISARLSLLKDLPVSPDPNNLRPAGPGGFAAVGAMILGAPAAYMALAAGQGAMPVSTAMTVIAPSASSRKR